MTDNDIIKAYGLCHSDVLCDETNCPFFSKCKTDDLSVYILDLINRQKEEIESHKHYYNECLKELAKAKVEIERLQTENQFWGIRYGLKADEQLLGIIPETLLMKNQIKAEVVKEFAAKLKAKVNRPEFPWEDFFVCESDIDEVLKEMVGAD